MLAFKEQNKNFRIRILLGGSENEYDSEFFNFDFDAGYFQKNYINEYNGNLNIIPRLECGTTAECNILSAETGYRDKNKNSIVLEIKHKNCSIMLTGDAPGNIIDKLLSPYQEDPSKKITIFQASHHGADSENSNSARHFEFLRPEYCIISAGSRKDYGHPRQKILLNALSSQNIKENRKSHFLKYYSDWSFIDLHNQLSTHSTIARLEDDFLIGFTKLGIFSTASQGDIHFENDSFTFPNSIFLLEENNAQFSELDLILDFLQKFPLKNPKLLSFKLPTIQFTIVNDFEKFIHILITNNPHLIYCDISQADLSLIITDENIEPIIARYLDMIEHLTTLNGLDLPDHLEQNHKVKRALRGSWEAKHNNSIRNLRIIS